MTKSQLLNQGNYLTVIKPVAHQIGLEETIILIELVGVEEYKYEKHLDKLEELKSEGKEPDPNKFQYHEEDQFFQCTEAELEFNTTLSRKKQDRALNNLKSMNLLNKEKRGLPSKRFIKLNHDEIAKLTEECLNNYKSFRKSFYKEKREKLKQQKQKAKERKAELNQNVQNGQSDQINVTQKEPQFKKDVQNGQPRLAVTDSQGCPKRTTINNSLYNNVLHNNSSLNKEREREEQSSVFSESINQFFLNNNDNIEIRLNKFNDIDMEILKNFYLSNKETLTDQQFIEILKRVFGYQSQIDRLGGFLQSTKELILQPAKEINTKKPTSKKKKVIRTEPKAKFMLEREEKRKQENEQKENTTEEVVDPEEEQRKMLEIINRYTNKEGVPS